MTQDKKFVEGLVFKEPRVGAPEFVVGSISIKIVDFKNWLLQNQEGDWMNIDVKRGRKSGKVYCEVSTWAPKRTEETNENPPPEEPRSPMTSKTQEGEEIDISDIPF